MALKLSCGQEGLQKSKQLCCSLLHAASAVWLKACLLLRPRSLQKMKGSALTVGKQHIRLRKDSTLPSLASLGAVAWLNS